MSRFFPSTTFLLQAILFLAVVVVTSSAQQILDAAEFLAGIERGDYDAVIDVRTIEEWTNVGHIANATLVEDLASNGTPVDILGCSSCTIAVYCHSGNRAGNAITRLQTEFGFTGTLYNAQGVTQWTAAGYPLVTTNESAIPPCAGYKCESCTAECPPPEDSGSSLFPAFASTFKTVSMVILMQL
jgi:rhodanese-related sulfurtransferase